MDYSKLTKNEQAEHLTRTGVHNPEGEPVLRGIQVVRRPDGETEEVNLSTEEGRRRWAELYPAPAAPPARPRRPATPPEPPAPTPPEDPQAP